MEIAGYIAAIFIGLSLGLTGGGGSILTVPVLVYLFGVEPLLATTYSLFIVGATSMVGGVRAYMNKLVDLKAVTLFGFPSVFSIFIARHFVVPVLPEEILGFSKGSFLMLAFALLMLGTSFYMMRPRKEDEVPDEESDNNPLSLIFPGLIVGFITGLLGAGGGFMIIPALVFLLHLPMRKAIGTSLLIISINSTFGFLFSLKQYQFNWTFLLSVTVLAIAGVVVGTILSSKIKNEQLRKIFGWFVLIMAIYILVKELHLF